MQFTDSISENIELLRELLGGLPPQHRRVAKKAAITIENVFTGLQKDHPKNAAVALGAAFAVFLLAERMCEAPEQGDSDKGLIQLLS
jgi:hypothetical protein